MSIKESRAVDEYTHTFRLVKSKKGPLNHCKLNDLNIYNFACVLVGKKF